MTTGWVSTVAPASGAESSCGPFSRGHYFSWWLEVSGGEWEWDMDGCNGGIWELAMGCSGGRAPEAKLFYKGQKYSIAGEGLVPKRISGKGVRPPPPVTMIWSKHLSAWRFLSIPPASSQGLLEQARTWVFPRAMESRPPRYISLKETWRNFLKESSC